MYSAAVLTLRSLVTVLAMSFLCACSLSEDQADILLRKARDLEFAGHFKEAGEAYQKMPVLISKDANYMQLAALMNQARFYLKAKEYEKAVVTCEKAEQVCKIVYGADDMLNASIFFILACAYDGLDKYDLSISQYQKVMTFAQRSRCDMSVVVLLPLIKLGDIEFKKKNLEQALKFYQDAYDIGGVLSTDMISRLISYRMALCSLVLGNNDKTEFYFKNSLPHLATNAAPKNIITKYAAFLSKCGKYKEAELALKESKDWYEKNKEYVNWQSARSGPSSRTILIDKYTEQDYYLVDAIEQSLINK